MKRIWYWFIGAPFVSWSKQIEAWKTETPLALPAIKPLKAQRAKAGKRRGRVANFTRGRL